MPYLVPILKMGGKSLLRSARNIPCYTSTSEAVQLQQAPTAPAVQQSVAPTTPKQAAVRSPTAATHTQQKTPVTTDVQSPTDRTDVTPH